MSNGSFTVQPRTGVFPEQCAGQGKRDKELWKVSLQFEALLLQQMISAMRKTVPHSSLLPSGFADDVYRSMFDQAIADMAGNRSTLGIAESVYRQLSNHHSTQVHAPTSDNQRSAVQTYGGGHGTH